MKKSPLINGTLSNLAFDREINNAKAWLQEKIIDTCGYSSDVLLERLMQRLVETGLYPYSILVSGLCKLAGNCALPSEVKIDCGRASLEIGTGRVEIAARQWLANQYDFLLHWVFCLTAILSVQKAARDKPPAVLVLGIGDGNLFAGGSDKQFVAYCRSGPVEPLRVGQYFILQTALKNPVSSCPAFSYARNPLIKLLREAHLGFGGRLRLLLGHFALFFSYMSATVRLPQLSLLGKDFAYSSAALELDRCGLIQAIVLTISSYGSQPLWMRGLKHGSTHMVWYAQNFSPVAYVGDELRSDIPALRWIRVDVHWVWTHAFARYLASLVPSAAMRVVGPIVWYLPEVPAPVRSDDAIELVVFDVSPFSDDIALQYGQITNYNSPPNLFAFIRDVSALKPVLEDYFHRPVFIRLKTKRGYNAVYDRAYFDYIEELDAENVLSLEHHASNIFSLISSSHLTIIYPFTSPAYIAESLNVPSIYHDPTGTILRQDFGDVPSLITFTNNPKDLLDAVISILTPVFAKDTVVREV